MQQARQLDFGPFRLDFASRCLWREGQLMPMRPKAFEVLAALVTRAGEVVTKEVLLDQVWPNTAVSDTVLKVCLREIRQVLGDSAKTPTYVATVHRRGYRFMAEVSVLEDIDAAQEVLAQVSDWLQREQRLSYRAIQRQFNLDAEDIEDLKAELIYSKRLAVDENSRVLVWTGGAEAEPEHTPLSYTPNYLAENILTSRRALEGERKQVTVLCCNLVDSAAIAESIGPESMHMLLKRFFELSLDVIHRYEGAVNQFLGDGLMALFGAPLALEDHARRGVLAAIALQGTLQEADLGQPYRVACQFRVGLNSGLVVVGSIGDNLRMDYSAVGDTTNLAAYFQDMAGPGDIMIGESTCRLVKDDVRLQALAPVQVKGKAELVTPYKVMGIRPRGALMASRSERVLSPFVGRERDMATLHALFAQVEAGHGQIIGVVAEAGQGKSRLLYEFRHDLQDKPVTYLEGHCLSYGGSTPYHLVIDIVRHHCRITETDGPEALIEKVQYTLQALGVDVEESSPYILQLLGVKEETESLAAFTPAAVRARTFELLKQMSIHASQMQPLILEIEDLHWIDQTSEAFLASLIDNLLGASIMLLTTYRPGYRPPWIEKSYATQLSLMPLTAPDALTVVQSASLQADLSEPVMRTILAKAEGNPFFLEELTQVVLAQDDRQNEMTVPDTIQGVLMARIDRLDEPSKHLLQLASILGREWSLSLLEAIWDDTEALDPLLRDLKQLEFFYERAGGEEPIYVFKHALTQEVAYESLLAAHRQTFHAQAGMALERLYPASLTERYEALAHHFTLGQVWDHAFNYLLKSGDKARHACANSEAMAFYTQAIEVIPRITPALEASQRLPVYEGRGLVWLQLTRLDKAIADFQIMLELARASMNRLKEGESLCRLSRAHQMTFSEEAMPFVEQYAQEAFELAQQTGNQTILAMSLAELGHLDAKHGDLPEADRKFEVALQISRQEGHKDSLVLLLFALSRQANWQGDFQRAIEFGQEGVSISRDLHDGNHELTNGFFLSLACWGAGRYAQAFTVIDEGLAKAKDRQNMLNVIRLTNTLGWFHREFGDVHRALEYDHESVDMGRAYHLPDPEISALINLGLDYLALGQYERALTYLEPTLERVEKEAFGVHRWRWKIRLFIGLADLFYTTGDYDQALPYVEQGVQEAQVTSSQKYLALGWALRSKITAKLDHSGRTGEDVYRAFALAEQLGSPSLVYPIAYDLGQWCETTGKAREAAAAYTRAQTAIEQMVTAVGDDALCSTLLQSELVRLINESVERLGNLKSG